MSTQKNHGRGHRRLTYKSAAALVAAAMTKDQLVDFAVLLDEDSQNEFCQQIQAETEKVAPELYGDRDGRLRFAASGTKKTARTSARKRFYIRVRYVNGRMSNETDFSVRATSSERAKSNVLARFTKAHAKNPLVHTITARDVTGSDA